MSPARASRRPLLRPGGRRVRPGPARLPARGGRPPRRGPRPASGPGRRRHRRRHRQAHAAPRADRRRGPRGRTGRRDARRAGAHARRGSPCTPPTAEALPFGAASLDAATAAQAVHWFGPAWADELVAHAPTRRRDRRSSTTSRDRTQPRAGRDLGRPRAGGRRRAVVRQRSVAGAARGVRRAGRRRVPTASRGPTSAPTPRCSTRSARSRRSARSTRRTATGCWRASRRCSSGEPDPVALRCTTEVTLWRRASPG